MNTTHTIGTRISVKETFRTPGPEASNSHRHARGTVLSVGEKVQSIKVGDTVYYGYYCGTVIDDCIVLFSEDILLVSDTR